MEQATASVIGTNSSILAENIEHVPETFDRNLVNLESHQLVWLASKHIHNQVPIKTLRKIIDYTKLFEDIETCAKYINNSKEILTFVIISDKISEEILSCIYNLSDVLGIYIHNISGEDNNEKYVSNYRKVKLIANEMDLILEQLDKDVQMFLKQDKSIVINNSSSNSLPEEEMSHGDSLSWWSIFLDHLLYHLPYPKEECQRKLTDEMINYYSGNPTVVGIVKEFGSNYKPEHAIKWYTRETFVYRVLNKAFRQHNLTLLFLFGFFIQDLYEQLKVEYQKFKFKYLSSDVITVYRAQLMWNEEIQDIKNGYNKIVNWCLFSSTCNRDITRIYLNDFVQPTDPIQNVLFEIKIDCRKTSYPYADISTLSYFPNESEILFMTGTAFHITDDIVYNEVEKRWLIKLELDEDRRKMIDDNSLSNPNNNVSIRTCLKRVVRTLLQRLAEISTDDIYIIFQKISELFPTEKKWLFAIRSHCVANHEEHRYGSASTRFPPRLANYDNALVIWQQYIDDIELNCRLDIGDIHMEIGRYYTDSLVNNYENVKIHFNLALKNYELAQKSIFIGNNEKTAVYENVIDIYQMKIDYGDKSDETLEMALKNRQSYVEHLLKFRDPNDVILAENFERLAELYKFVEKYDEALVNYEKALEISKNQTSPDYNGILRPAKEIVDIYSKYKSDPHSALQYQDIIRDMESKEEVKFGNFMTASELLKQKFVD